MKVSDLLSEAKKKASPRDDSPLGQLKELSQPIGINGGSYTYWVDVTKTPLKFTASDGSELDGEDGPKTLKDIGRWMAKWAQEYWNEFLDGEESLEFMMEEGIIKTKKGGMTQQDHERQMREGKAGVAVAQPKDTINRLRKSGTMMPKGHFHKKGEDWESTEVTRPKGKK